jgi:DNA polymerase
MISNQIIQEALIRLKRSGKKHIFLSEESQSHIQNIHIGDRSEPEVDSAVDESLKQNSEPKAGLDSLELSKGTKSENIILLKEALANLFPNEKLLFGKGSLDPKIVFLSEYPSAEEFQNNSLCVGKVNELMEKIVKAMGISQDDVYFTAIIKSKTLSNTLLQQGHNSSVSKEKEIYIEYLKKELSLIKPSIIISLGELAYTLLMDKEVKKDEFNQIRGQLVKFSEYPTVPTSNPSYLLLKDSLETKRLFWEDLLMAMNELKLEISEQQQNYFK